VIAIDLADDLGAQAVLASRKIPLISCALPACAEIFRESARQALDG
jgi:hypothetical protein